MRVVLDTNILASALLVKTGAPGDIFRAWSKGRFTLLTCQTQLREMRATLRKPALAPRIRPHHAGSLLNDLKLFAESVDPLPRVKRSPDPDDDFATGNGRLRTRQLPRHRRQERTPRPLKTRGKPDYHAKAFATTLLAR